jgi:hypothetical protein
MGIKSERSIFLKLFLRDLTNNHEKMVAGRNLKFEEVHIKKVELDEMSV